MSRYLIPLTAAFGLLVAPASYSLHAADKTDVKLFQRASQIHKRIVAFDSHVDLPFDYAGAAADGKAQIDLPKVERGQLKGAALAMFVPQGPRTPEGYAKARQDADKKYALIKAFAEDNPARAAIAYSPADVRRIAGQGKFAVVISLLNAYPLGADLSQIDEWYKRGVRVFGYVHAGHNDWADSSRPSAALGNKPEEHGGLSAIGRQGIARLNDLGMLIDVSQLSTPAFKQALSLTRAPVVATHSGVKGIVDNSRNLSDEELALLKQNGGVIQIVAFSNYVREMPKEITDQFAALQAEFGFRDGRLPTDISEARRKEYAERNQKIAATEPHGTVAQLVNVIDYAVKKIGVDHVGIASDFNHGGGVTGWDNEGECQNVTVELLRRGYSEKDIGKLWGGNFLRVWGEAQKLAKASAK
ncbi:MAG TPA: dipeptidase [Bryobacteraceae bacterium]|nr:dipeptidase [Bryobacteraceae bacterium]